MKKHLRRPGSVTPLGPRYWKYTAEPSGAFRVAPYGFNLVACLAGVAIFGVIAALWYVRAVPHNVKLAMSAIGGAGGASMVSVFLWLHYRERRLGAYLAVNRHEILLRDGVRIPLNDFDKVSIVRRWELAGDGMVKMSYLVLTCKRSMEFEVVCSMYNGDIVALKRKIEESMHGLLGLGGTTP